MRAPYGWEEGKEDSSVDPFQSRVKEKKSPFPRRVGDYPGGTRRLGKKKGKKKKRHAGPSRAGKKKKTSPPRHDRRREPGRGGETLQARGREGEGERKDRIGVQLEEVGKRDYRRGNCVAKSNTRQRRPVPQKGKGGEKKRRSHNQLYNLTRR